MYIFFILCWKYSGGACPQNNTCRFVSDHWRLMIWKLKLRNLEKVTKQTLQAKFIKKMKEYALKDNKGNEKWKNKKLNDEWVCKNTKNQGDTSKHVVSHNKKFNKVEMKEVHGRCCQKFGDYARHFYFNIESNASGKKRSNIFTCRQFRSTYVLAGMRLMIQMLTTFIRCFDDNSVDDYWHQWWYLYNYFKVVTNLKISQALSSRIFKVSVKGLYDRYI